MDYRILPLGDRAVTFEFGDQISKETNHLVLGLHGVLKEGSYEGIIETVPTFRSLTVHYDPLVLFPEDVEALVRPLINTANKERSSGKSWVFPVCYEGEYAPDLEEAASQLNISPDALVEIHRQKGYDVFMLGFLPGFGFLGVLDERLVLPRRTEPRTAVPKGSLAIADLMTAVYPSQSPGGWNLIGRTPIEFFDLAYEQPALLSAGDHVSFKPIAFSEYEPLEKAIQAGELDVREAFLV